MTAREAATSVDAAQARRAKGLALYAAVVLLVVSLPALAVGFFNDDYVHRAVLEGKATGYAPNPLALYEFVPRDPARVHALAEVGALPWWTVPELALRFFRPLSSLTVAADAALFGHAAIPAHLHSLLWFALLVATAWALLRRVVSAEIAALACVIYAVAGYHVTGVTWIAARHVLVSGSLALVAVYCHVRRREESWHAGAWLTPLALGAALLGGESALGGAALILAYEALGARGERNTRVVAAAPTAFVVAVYLAAYVGLGYGARAAGSYIDPLREPGRFVPEVVARIVALMAEAIVGIPSDMWAMHPLRAPLIAVGFVALVASALLVWRVAPRFPEGDRRNLRWLAVGGVLAMVPALPGFVGGRLLTIAGVGLSAVVAAVLVHGLRASRSLRVACLVLAFFQLGLSPLVRLAQQLMFGKMSRAQAAIGRTANLGCAPGAMANLVGASDPSVAMYAAPLLVFERAVDLRGWRHLSMAAHDLTLARTGPSSFELAVVGGSMLETEFENVFRPRTRPFAPGDAVQLSDMTARIVEVNGVGPTRVRFEFDGALEDTRRCFVTWKGGELRGLEMPPVGGALVIPHEPGPMGM